MEIYKRKIWKLPQPRIPSSTYRLQFNHWFKFIDVKIIIPYLNSLGISDIYSSPYFKAQKESLHGYDIVDPNALNPEIGTEEEYNELIKGLHKYGMGQILDIVPNHMCITSKDNVWWMDLLENGPSSLYARFFDIDWNPLKKELNEKVLIPILGGQYGRVLENQELKLTFEEGAFFINYFTHKFPIIPKTYIHILQHRITDLEKLLSPDNPGYMELLSIITAFNHLPPYTERDSEKIAERYSEKEIIKMRLWSLYNENPAVREFINENLRLFNGNKGESMSFDLLDRLITEQSYRLSYWQVATDEINYRRFFDINSLVSIRIEDPVVFNETHKLIFRLIGEGKVTGLRVDHPDGLYNPSEYFRQLQRNCFLHLQYLKQEESDLETEALKFYEEALLSNPHYKPFYIVGEKILAIGEKMPEDWQIFSTTGYVFMNLLKQITGPVMAKGLEDTAF
jgi:(1->4)-alpha-D-glucan 1-alpha-D-glucosylmutase